MSIYRPRETKRARLKLSKNIARIYRESKCRECSVVVSPMDFAKILGKFTKVKIQYESNSTPKSKQASATAKETSTPNSNARLKSNENGMVLIHRNAYNQHPVKDSCKKQPKVPNNTSRQPSNILKENNRLKKAPLKDKINTNYNNKQKQLTEYTRRYGIIFTNPDIVNNEIKNEVFLCDLLPVITETILPSKEWDIDYFPKEDEPKEDKVYDRIAAELEDLMYNDKKPDTKQSHKESNEEKKVDDFPSIMDILNDSSSIDNDIKSKESTAVAPNLESSDVEAMLLGETEANKPLDDITTNVLEQTEADKSLEAIATNEEDKPLEAIVTNVIDEIEEYKPLEAIMTNVTEQTETEKPLEAIMTNVADQTETEKPLEAIMTNVADQTETEKPLEAIMTNVADQTEEDKPLEAIIPNVTDQPDEDKPLEASMTNMIDQTDVNKLIEDVTTLNDKTEDKPVEVNSELISPPKCDDEILQQNTMDSLSDEHKVNAVSDTSMDSAVDEKVAENKDEPMEVDKEEPMEVDKENETVSKQCTDDSNFVSKLPNLAKVTHVVFKQMKNGNCCKSVMCPKNLKYSIELEGKSVELLGAPQFISSLDDLQVLLQIVNESGLTSFNVLH